MASIDTALPARLWYVRRNGKQLGPFPATAIVEDVVLGRLAENAEVSADRVGWTRIANVPQFAARGDADGPSDATTPPSGEDWSHERDLADRRWADGRSGTDRRQAPSGAAHPPRRKGLERRAVDPSVRRHVAQRRESSLGVDRRAQLGFLVAGALLALSIGIAGALLGPVKPVAVDLGVAARPAQ